MGVGWGGGRSLIAESRQFFSKNLEFCVCIQNIYMNSVRDRMWTNMTGCYCTVCGTCDHETTFVPA